MPEPYANPSAVMLLLFRHTAGKTSVLLQHRHNVPALNNLWDTAASGHVQADETLRQAMAREAWEELGITIAPDDLHFRALGHILVSPGYTYYNIYFEAAAWQGEPYIREKDKCDGLAWFDVDALPDDIIPQRKQAIHQCLRGILYHEAGFA